MNMNAAPLLLLVALAPQPPPVEALDGGTAVRMSVAGSPLLGDVSADGVMMLSDGRGAAWLDPLLRRLTGIAIEDDAVVLERRGIRETWTSTSAGLQQTFEVAAATSADGLEVEIAVAGLFRVAAGFGVPGHTNPSSNEGRWVLRYGEW